MIIRFTNMMGKLSEGGRAVLSIGMVAASKAQKNLGRSSLLLFTGNNVFVFGIHPWLTLEFPALVICETF